MIDLSLMPTPSHVIETGSLNVMVWGWPGIIIDEKLVLRYEYHIQDLVCHLNSICAGVYFILMQCHKTKSSYFFSDRFAAKKIFILEKNNTIFLSDFLYKYKQMIQDENEIDWTSIYLFLMFGFIPNNGTLYKSVKSLKPYTYYRFSKKRLSEVKTTSIEFDEKITRNNYCPGETLRLLEEGFKRSTSPFNRFLIPLSGGRDSRLLLALAMKNYQKEQITTFTFGQKGTFDYEMGKRIAKIYRLKHEVLEFSPRDYFEKHVRTSTILKSGLVNHANNSPAPIYEKILSNDHDTLILSGYLGDGVLAWSHQKTMVQNEDGCLYPKPYIFNFNELTSIRSDDLAPNLMGQLIELAKSAVDGNGIFEPELWLYNVHVPYFTNPCMFMERELYPIALPFIERELLNFLFKIPREIKQKKSFYEDIIRNDPFIYSFFKWPLKTLRGGAYGRRKIQNVISRMRSYGNAFFRIARPMKNYIHFEKAYSEKFLKKNVVFPIPFDFMNILHDKPKMEFKKKVVLLSLKLNLEQFF